MLLSTCVLTLHDLLNDELGCSEFSGKLADADFAFAFQSADVLDFPLIEALKRRPSDWSATPFGFGHAHPNSGPKNFALELSYGTENVVRKAPGRGRSIQILL
jgi:hypothetical protein